MDGQSNVAGVDPLEEKDRAVVEDVIKSFCGYGSGDRRSQTVCTCVFLREAMEYRQSM